MHREAPWSASLPQRFHNAPQRTIMFRIMEIGEAIKNPAYRIFQTEYSGCLDISAHA